jgi:hypothetical protein
MLLVSGGLAAVYTDLLAEAPQLLPMTLTFEGRSLQCT